MRHFHWLLLVVVVGCGNDARIALVEDRIPHPERILSAPTPGQSELPPARLRGTSEPEQAPERTPLELPPYPARPQINLSQTGSNARIEMTTTNPTAVQSQTFSDTQVQDCRLIRRGQRSPLLSVHFGTRHGDGPRLLIRFFHPNQRTVLEGRGATPQSPDPGAAMDYSRVEVTMSPNAVRRETFRNTGAQSRCERISFEILDPDTDRTRVRGSFRCTNFASENNRTASLVTGNFECGLRTDDLY